MKKKLYILFGIAFLALFAVACNSNDPTKTVQNYFEALQKGDYKEAMSLTTIESDEEIESQAKKLEGIELKVSDFEVVSKNVADDGQTAEVEVKYRFSSVFNETPEESSQTIGLVKQDGKWKIKD